MSRAAYEGFFGVSAPANAIFASDISYWQSDSVWNDLVQWCDSVCIRTSFGASGDDGRQANHFARANEVGFKGTLGTYHYVIPNSGWQGNTNNYLNRSSPYVDSTKYDMLDFEEGPVASAAFIDAMCDAIEQARQRPCLIYGGKSYLDQAGTISCPASKLWVAEYPGRSANPWVPTTDWNSWNAPLMPNQYGEVLPGVWQWSSSAIGYSLDLDISCTPGIFGIGIQAGDDFLSALSDNQQFDLANRVEAMYNAQNGRDFDALGLLRDIFNYTTWNEQRAPELTRKLELLISYIGTGGTNNPIDVKALAKAIVASLIEELATISPKTAMTENTQVTSPRRPLGVIDTPNGAEEVS